MLKDFKPEIKLFLLVALVAVVLSVGGILLLRELFPTPTVQQKNNNQESATDTSGWQTYRSDEFGFEVRYPGDFQEKYEYSSKEFAARSTKTRRGLGISISEGETSLQTYLTKLDQLRATADEDSSIIAVLKRYEIRIAGYPSITQEVQVLADALIAIETFVNVTPQMIVRISTEERDYKGPEPDDSLKQLHNQILSTFRFLNDNG